MLFCSTLLCKQVLDLIFGVDLLSSVGLFEVFGHISEAPSVLFSSCRCFFFNLLDHLLPGERIVIFYLKSSVMHVRIDHIVYAASERPQENYTEAIPLLERALAIQINKLGENHPDTVKTQKNLEAVRKKVRAKLGGRVREPHAPRSARRHDTSQQYCVPVAGVT